MQRLCFHELGQPLQYCVEIKESKGVTVSVFAALNHISQDSVNQWTSTGGQIA